MSENEKDNKNVLTLKLNNLKNTDKFNSRIKQSFSHGKTKSVEVEIRGKKTISKDSLSFGDNKFKVFPNLNAEEIQARLNAVNAFQKNENKVLPPIVELNQNLGNLNQTDIDKNVNNKIKIDENAKFNTNISSVNNFKVKETENLNFKKPLEEKFEVKIEDKSDQKIEKVFSKKYQEGSEVEKHGSVKKSKKAKFVSFSEEYEDFDDLTDDFINDEIDDEDPKQSQIKKTNPKTKVNNDNSKLNQQKFLKKHDNEDKKRDIMIPINGLFISDLAHRLSVDILKIESVIRDLGENTHSKKISKELAEIIIQNFGFNPVMDNVEGILAESNEKSFIRPPVVVVMGHVDHGKTSLLDKMRQSDVAKHEKGGITQHIGAYGITTKNQKKITFIDTPGHALFKEMRERGAKFTDIAVLVVAADDGIKEQTIEAIRHAQTAGSPIIVAINKIDKEGSNIERIRTELMNYDVVVEAFGGDTIEVHVSAKTGQGMEDLQNAIILQSEMMGLKTYEKGKGTGFIIESKVDKGQGSVATVLLIDGSIKEKDFFVCGESFGKIRSMTDDSGRKIKSCGPSSAVVVCGFNTQPTVGDTISIVKDEKDAKIVVDFRKSLRQTDQKIDENPFSKINVNKNEKPDLKFIVKADVAGSLDAIKFGLESLSNEEVKVTVIRSDVGDISENDLSVAEICGASVIGFNVKTSFIKEIQKYEKISVEYYNIIYRLIDTVSAKIKEMIGKKFNERYIGSAEVIKVFDMKDDSGKFRVAGCIVRDGEMQKSQKVKIIRNGKVIFSMGEMKSLEIRRVNSDIVPEKEECGIVVKKYTGIEVSDVIECFSID